ncbi:MAG: hypothetical protein GYB31_01810 [Bacteroidetes bacterium]|nr:hypothetical protein [Bacteroidota bacterium]
MNQLDMVYCVSEVYDSSKAAGFAESEKYPIAWEVMFRNDNAGKQLIENIYSAFEQLPKERGQVIGLDGEHSFKQILNKALNGLALFDENANQVVPRQQLVDIAKSIGRVVELAY